ncbi:S-adenosylmethionine synthase [Elysia marginata]|uniref:S-adenosylmethionine synthase n=1 Tax=Elysia marginata TaxID=1093978 RepID=A0AAV4GJ62_9GAST|nr:S-adenosylmethionine synthase [Elysia marginata]
MSKSSYWRTSQSLPRFEKARVARLTKIMNTNGSNHIPYAGNNVSNNFPGEAMAENDTFLFTSESVGEGHPDKICDQVSDAIVDAFLQADPFARVSCQCAAKTGMIFVCGDVVSKAKVDYHKIVRNTIKSIGYDGSVKGFDYKTCNVLLAMEEPDPEMSPSHMYHEADSVEYENAPAGDQGLMFGYATDETEECMPLTILLSHQLNAKIAELRKNGALPWARPDTKTQVTVEYRIQQGATVPVRVHTVVISVQHDETVTQEQLRQDLREKVISAVIPAHYLDSKTVYHLQPSGRFIIGGPQGDAGLTGRKIIVDTYGGWGAHGGGSLSGKDGAKIDRCASYAARWVAKSLVKAGLCRRALVQISYAMGVSEPLSITVFSFGTSSKSEEDLLRIIKNNFDLRPGKIIQDLDLRKPKFLPTAAYGHFGRPGFSWEVPKPLTI